LSNLEPMAWGRGQANRCMERQHPNQQLDVQQNLVRRLSEPH
jgi:hypothetical protein